VPKTWLLTSKKKENASNFEYTAPEFTFERSTLNIVEENDGTSLPVHFLGKNVAEKFNVFKNAYVYEDGLRINIEKPIIYKSIKKINKHYIKQVKKGDIDRKIAEKELLHYLDIAIAIIAKPTFTFENALKNAKSVKGLIQVFNNVKLI
jgi:hypothetical protein